MKTASKKTPKPAPIADMSLPIGQLVDAAYNPRKEFDAAELEEMTGTMKEHGVLEPLLVRPLPDSPAKAPKWEVMSGHKRLRAARAAGLKCVPCRVHTVDDKEARAIAIIGNIHTNPTALEQGAAYRELIDLFGFSVQAAADYLGESVHAVRALVALKNLPPLAEAALKDGRLPIATAGLIAGIPTAPQRERLALAVLTGVVHREPCAEDLTGDCDPLTHAETKVLIVAKFMRQLKGCAWDTKDKQLLPEAGPCTTCPKRAGNAAKIDPDAYGDLRADMCLDVACFGAKAKISIAAAIAKADAAGMKTVTGYLASQVGLFNSAYLFLDHKNEWIPFALPNATTLREFLADLKIELAGVMLAVNDDGLSREIVNASWAARMLAPKAPSPAPPSPSNGKSKPRQVPLPVHFDKPAAPALAQDEPAEDARPTVMQVVSARDEVAEAAIPKVLDAIDNLLSGFAAGDGITNALRAVALALVRTEYHVMDNGCLEMLQARRGISGHMPVPGMLTLDCWASWIKAASAGKLLALIAEVPVRQGLDGLPNTPDCRALLDVAGLSRDELIHDAEAKRRPATVAS